MKYLAEAIIQLPKNLLNLKLDLDDNNIGEKADNIIHLSKAM